VTHIHNPSYQILNNYGISFRRRQTARLAKYLVSRFASHIAGTSKQMIREYGFNHPAFESIPKAALHCGFETARFRLESRNEKRSLCEEFNWPDDAKIVLFAGRIDTSAKAVDSRNHKNSRFAIDVVLKCLQDNPKVRMIMAGAKSSAVDELIELINSAGANGKVAFAGVRQDIERLMKAADCLFFPSRGEGLGMVAVEAQAAGLPVLMSTAVPEESVVVRELVTRLDLALGLEPWSVELLAILDRGRMRRDDANRIVRESPFSIQNSTRALRNLYSRGILSNGLS